MEQLVVLGMHRSGTSLVAGLLSKLGLYVGEEPELLAPQPDNPKGFFERSDVVAINDALLAAQDATWDRPLGVLNNRNPEHIQEFPAAKIRELVSNLESHSPFLIKDPRFCLTINTWQKYLDNPVYLFVYRDPVEIALSLQRRNRMPITVGIALWEFYIVNLLQSIAGKKVVVVDHASALADPQAFLRDTGKKLEALGFALSGTPDEGSVKDFVFKNQSVKQQDLVSAEGYMTEPAIRLANVVRAGDFCVENLRIKASGACIDTLSIYPGIETGVGSRDSKHLQKLKEIVTSLRVEHIDLSNAYKRDRSELASLKEKYQSLDNHNTKLSTAYQNDRKELETLKDEIKAATEKNTQLRSSNERIRVALNDHQNSVFGRLVAAFTKVYKLITFKLGKPTALEYAVAVTQQQNGMEVIRKFNAKTDFFSKFDLFLLLARRMLHSPIRTLRAVTLSRVKNVFKVFFGMPKHQASLVVGNAVQRHFEVESEEVSLDEYKGELIQLASVDRPQVSILIPVYNKLSVTLNCIQSVYEHTDSELNPYEIVLADDCSTDETQHISKYVQGLKHIKQPRNVGFLKNCNQAAKACDGEFIVLLNNDTLVQEGWLANLIQLISSEKNIGMVGPKFLFENGTLQEAGGIIWSDASGWNWGRGLDPALPEYNYIRDVDYLSGACILLRKKLWDEFNGFDEDFSPAYYEDTDLAFRMRSKGYRVCYQPLSKVVHLEGVSHGTDVSSGIKNFQELNREKFRLKWLDVLESTHFDNGKNVFLARERAPERKTILVIDHHVPQYDRDAGSRCSYQYLKLFQKAGLKVIFLGDNFYPHQPYTTELQRLGIEVLYGNWYAANWQHWLITNARYIDYVYLQRPHIVGKYLEVLRQLPERPRLIYFGHDLHFLRVKRQSEIEGSSKLQKQSEKWKQQEFEIFEQVDVVCYPSEHEVEIVKKINPGLNVKAIPLNIFEHLNTDHPAFSTRNSIIFVGGYGHPPNLDAVKWFVEEVFPAVLKSLPQLEFVIVGSNPPADLLALQSSSVRIVGEVSDERLAQLYDQAKAAVVPLRFGAGVKGKVLESLSKGVPVVTTPVGAEGIPEVASCMSVATAAVDFAEAVIEVVSDEAVWNRLSQGGLRVINQHFSEQYVIDTVFEKLGIVNHAAEIYPEVERDIAVSV